MNNNIPNEKFINIILSKCRANESVIFIHLAIKGKVYVIVNAASISETCLKDSDEVPSGD